ncbi:unnamed protein product [Eruca vesicaria subsp. sativa]|uniref:Uncharacterized protein n=1 Tax=Eruca vesicaria subsp. sativa TaxID=29727 RepID=A0ABC8LGW5_ERUVS|nr:unnamed protein product [Eruca vesicaria subsp. sativa]
MLSSWYTSNSAFFLICSFGCFDIYNMLSLLYTFYSDDICLCISIVNIPSAHSCLWISVVLSVFRYMSTLGNKKIELFDMGAGPSAEPTADENVQVASAMSNQELVDAGMKRMDETD